MKLRDCPVSEELFCTEIYHITIIGKGTHCFLYSTQLHWCNRFDTYSLNSSFARPLWLLALATTRATSVKNVSHSLEKDESLPCAMLATIRIAYVNVGVGTRLQGHVVITYQA